jgi:hypothetical protein
MTPATAIDHILNSVDGLEIEGGHDDTVTTLLAAATAIAGIALMRIQPSERERLLFGIEPAIRQYIAQVNAHRAVRANGNGSIAMHSPTMDG